MKRTVSRRSVWTVQIVAVFNIPEKVTRKRERGGGSTNDTATQACPNLKKKCQGITPPLVTPLLKKNARLFSGRNKQKRFRLPRTQRVRQGYGSLISHSGNDLVGIHILSSRGNAPLSVASASTWAYTSLYHP